MKSNDPVLIGFVRSLLQDADIPHVVFDTNMSVMEGSVGILPQRVVIAEDDIGRARVVLHAAGLSHECA